MTNFAQICFSKDADLQKVEEQLETLLLTTDYQFISCFLPLAVVEDAGFDTTLCLLLIRVMGDRHTFALQEEVTFIDAMDVLFDVRKEVANKVHKMFVLDSGVADGVREEVSLFINEKLVLMP